MKTHARLISEGMLENKWLKEDGEDVELTLFNLYLCQVASVEEWVAKKRQRERDKHALTALLTDPAADKHLKQQRRCEYILQYARTLYSCPRCWLLPGLCVCKHMRTFTTRTQVLVHVHEREWGKCSNTGCIAAASLPGSSQVLLKGHAPHDALLDKVLHDPSITAAVLWPGEGAVLPCELRRIADERTNGRIAIVALDASWDGACRMKKVYPPGILHVALSPDTTLRHLGHSLLKPVRQYRGDQRSNGRVSTLEAIAHLLYELEGDQQLLEGLLDNLRVKVDAMLAQKLRKPLYGTIAAGLHQQALAGAAQLGEQMLAAGQGDAGAVQLKNQMLAARQGAAGAAQLGEQMLAAGHIGGS